MTTLVIVAHEGYQDHELAGTLAGLRSAGHEITIASDEKGVCSGKFGGKTNALIALRDADASAYDIVAFIGGPGAMAFVDDQDALRIAREAARQKKTLGAICIAPVILARAGVLDGRRATVWNSDGAQAKVLGLAGAMYTGEDVTVDGNIITANGPAAAAEFGKKLGQLFPK